MTDVPEISPRKRLSSGSGLPPRAGRLRKRSLSSAQLPLQMDDPRWMMHLEQSKCYKYHVLCYKNVFKPQN